MRSFHRITSHRIASHRIASHRIASHRSTAQQQQSADVRTRVSDRANVC
jgi:hypothetical protein